jgi:large subunit ribosomal protein L21
MYAIVKTGGKQYKVAEGDVITVEKLLAAPGDSIALTPLLVVDGESRTLDADGLAAARVTGEVVAQTKGPKIKIHKYKNKTGYHKRMGHRQKLTEVKIISVSASASTPAEADSTDTATSEEN